MHTFQQAVRSLDLTVTAELPLTAASTRRSIEADATVLGKVTDALQVTDNPLGVPHPSPLVTAMICLDCGLDPVLHLTGRDRNRVALQSDILGAAQAGITSLLLYRGEKIPPKTTPRPRKVYELGAKRLLRCASLIGEETGLVPSPGFFLGSMISVIRPREDWQPRGIEAKVGVGCKFVQTQPLLDVALLRRYMERLVANRVMQRVTAVVSVPLLSKVAQLDTLLERPRPAAIPRELVARLRNSRTPRNEGIAMAVETLRAVKEIPGVGGVNLVAIEDVDAAVDAISLSEIRAGGDSVA